MEVISSSSYTRHSILVNVEGKSKEALTSLAQQVEAAAWGYRDKQSEDNRIPYSRHIHATNILIHEAPIQYLKEFHSSLRI